MELKQLLTMAQDNKELKLENSYFHGEKIESLLKSLKKHHVLIDLQASFLNQGNCPDLVISYSGPSEGKFIFHGQMYSRPEIKANEKENRIIMKANEKKEREAEKLRAKTWRENQKTLKKVLASKIALKSFDYNKGYCWLYTNFEGVTIAKTFRGLESVELQRHPTGDYYFFTESSAVMQSAFWLKDFREIK